MQARFELALRSILADVPSQSDLRVAVAYSGGLDSAVLLQLCAAYTKQNPIQLMAFHVHHGLSPNADAWVTHCQQQCIALDVPFEVAHVQLGRTNDEGVEAAARKKRYAALGELCERHHVDIILTAHHQDDQAETMLLQLLRGAGVAGLCGMQQCHRAPGLLANTSVLLARPLLDCTRAELEDYAVQQHVQHVEDESNSDARYTRNALRHQIMPLLAQHFPAYQARFARTAQHAQSALYLLEQLAEQDYAHCLSSFGAANLDVLQLQQLPEARIDNVLRHWIALHHEQMPSTARLAEIRKQLLHARDDAQVSVKHGDIEVHRYRQQLSIATCAKPTPYVQNFKWQGETSIAFPAFSGVMHFDSVLPDQPGIDRTWLLAQQLEMRPRQGGERLKLAVNRPTRSMKSHYQTSGIPYWQRERLPFIFVGTELLFAAGIGVHGDFQVTEAECVTLRWQAD
ncbi:tRNA lysidine(34) synthetase TilS [Solimicrobium silvestre]|uniref:tRNA(Ile)-lysidine synthase n=1 Tax=Solimicrobium silvestre TaxID=2099400 RepID=A0A2S9GVY8_9BURK|nr:tRNA lysidine(34) synthetase TilS [Solimicrobium silvestre]PRC91883.1 tRNA(Ile)-lysidine synthetase [Solimicrobium silvestre]